MEKAVTSEEEDFLAAGQAIKTMPRSILRPLLLTVLLIYIFSTDGILYVNPAAGHLTALIMPLLRHDTKKQTKRGLN
ncbi:MAG: hypothetical protein Q4G07_03950 [Oscillospiraceae bacterium]|nr:hypothetical protein [Oscillospiraceae bacterium]